MSELNATPLLGTLTDRVVLSRRIDEAGIYSTIATVWARVRKLPTNAEGLTHVVTMRFRSDFGNSDRMTYRGVDLRVLKAFDLNGRRSYLQCQCREAA